MTDTPERCEECGGTACRAGFDFLLGREFEDADLRAVHHLTVLCYTLQHPVEFDATPEGHAGAWALLREAVGENLSAGELRRRNRARLRRSDRPRMRNRGRSHAPLPTAPNWTYSVGDVTDGPDDDYAGRVRAWAKAMVAEGKGR